MRPLSLLTQFLVPLLLDTQSTAANACDPFAAYPMHFGRKKPSSLISLSLHHPIQARALVPKPEFTIITFLQTIQC